MRVAAASPAGRLSVQPGEHLPVRAARRVAGRPGRMAAVEDLVSSARRLADDLLWPQASRADRQGVRRDVVDAVAAAGLMGLEGPPVVVREVQEALAGGCGATWFVLAQHRFPLAAVRDSPNAQLRAQWLGALSSGRTLAAVAFSHLRRPGQPPVTARHTEGGWRFDGTVSWTTSWGLADVLLLGGIDLAADRVLFALIPAVPQTGLSVRTLDLAVLGGTGTVSLLLDGLVVPERDMVAAERAADWRARDAQITSNVTPASYGLLWRICHQLAERDRGLARDLRVRGEALRERAYGLLDRVPAGEQLPERQRLRAATLVLVQQAAAAYVTASGGRGMDLDHPAQRLAREALFALVQAQTPPVRSATLDQWRG